MLAPPTPTMGPPPEAPKLRSSCDSCGTAKVKCDRVQPECRRCAALGLPCVYGQSRQFGKARRKRPGADLDTTTSVLFEKRTACAAESRGNHTTQGFGQPQHISEPGQLNFPDLVTNVFPTPFETDAIGIDEQNQIGSAFFPPYSLDEWTQLDSLGAGLETPPLPRSRPPASMLELSNTERTSPESQESHSCPRESYEIFRDLICPGPHLHAPEANSYTVSAELDYVLHFNSNAIGRLSRVLRCPCAKSGHRVMVHASIISRILIWYQQAAELTDRNSRVPRPSGLADPSVSCSASLSSPSRSGTTAGTGTASPPTLAQSTGFVVTHVPVSMGTFSIKDQNVQAAVRNQLVLCELKKTANLIELFTSRDTGESSINGVGSLYSHLGAWLRSEHSSTVRILRSRLNAINEDLDT